MSFNGFLLILFSLSFYHGYILNSKKHRNGCAHQHHHNIENNNSYLDRFSIVRVCYCCAMWAIVWIFVEHC